MAPTNKPTADAHSTPPHHGVDARSQTSPAQPGARRSALASTVGAVVDWYDFFLYGTAAALVFGDAFFPSDDPTVGTLAALGSFAVGFLFRPLGGAIFGHFGDRVGRRKMLMITVIIMGLVSTAIGLLPTYAAVGVAAPILLVTLRAIQGIAVGGEWGGAALMAVENAPPRRRNFMASGVQIGSFIGLLLGNAAFWLIMAFTTDAQFQAWGWRIPFAISIIFALVGLWIRQGVPESREFVEAAEKHGKESAPLVEALRTGPKQILAIIGMRLVDQSTFYLAFTFSLAFVKDHTDTSADTVLTASMIALVLAVPATSFWASLADRWGRRPFYIAGPLCAAGAGIPFFAALESGSLPLMALGFFMLINLGHNLSTCVQQTWFTDMFDARIRYSGAGFGYAVAGAVGGFVPLIATAISRSGDWMPVTLLLAVASLLALTAAMWSHKWVSGKTPH
ncbi:MFS transporter [Spirillospora sp. CA-255316]